MADDKDLSPEDKAKKDREEAVKAQDNPPQPYPSPEQLEKADGGPLDTDNDDDDDAKAQRKAKADAEKAKVEKTVAPNKPAGTYETR